MNLSTKHSAIATLAAAALTAAGCASHSKTIATDNADEGTLTVIPSTVATEMPRVIPTDSPFPSAAIPHAVVYRTNGDYNDNVPVTLNADRTAIVAYPAPSDILPTSSPLEVGPDNLLLDRRGGIGGNTAFLRYTYAEYAALPTAPSLDQLMEAVIPDARVTYTYTLPITVEQAEQFPNAIPSLIPAGK